MTTKMGRVAFIGAGAMAESIIKGLIAKKMLPPRNIIVTNRTNDDRLQQLEQDYGVHPSRDTKWIVQSSQIILLAMKPKDAQSGLDRIRPFVQPEHIVGSVMAGITTTFMEDRLPLHCAVVRTMPNTSSEIGRSSTTLCTGQHVSHLQQQLVEHLFQAIGTVTAVSEQDMDTTTALAGSGPAFLYYIAEAMMEAANSTNLDEHEIRELVANTMIGAGLMMKTAHCDVKQLRINITSPGGTTEAGLEALMDRKVGEAFKACIVKAANRSKELQEEYCKKEDNIRPDDKEMKRAQS
ncbi:pyrroline-5-carboxylate reductase [Pseudalkalibacillus sp. SCS-8]|uniref:pyrroline-5-carboxylate reductase n=1 Tax=Pseudalkalibacillus nanhaiensis TaxID=3115291 RepID=UPI0032DB2337